MDFVYWTTAHLQSLPCCRRHISKTKQERNTTSHLSVHGFCILDHSLLQSLHCCRRHISKTKQNPTAHLPCMDHVKLDLSISINAHIVVNAPEPATTLQHLNNLDACSPYQTPDVTRCVQVHFDAEFHPSSEDDVSSQPAKSLTPSSVAAPEQSGNMYFTRTKGRRRIVPPQITIPLF